MSRDHDFESMIQALSDPILLIEAGDQTGDARVVYANQAAGALFPGRSLKGPLVSFMREPGLLNAVEGGLIAPAERHVDYETGGVQPRIWRAQLRPLATGAGERARLLLVLHDETDARRTERMRADFLANASHELRTPLASLAGFVETLRGHARDDEAARDKFLGIMAQQAQRMARLIGDLLSLSRIELNEHVPPTTEADLGLLIGEVQAAEDPVLAERKVQLALDLPTSGLNVRGDRDQLIQVLQNLVDNAVKYSPPGAAVRVELRSDLSLEEAAAPSRQGDMASLLRPERIEGARYAQVRVTDAGPGIKRDDLPRLTERFYRAEGQRVTGTGLGLAIVKHIVNRHRGGLTVESAPGAGASFTVYLPQA